GREDDDGHGVALRAQHTEHLEPVAPREHDVEDHEVERLVATADSLEPGLAVVGDLDAVALRLEIHSPAGRDALVALRASDPLPFHARPHRACPHERGSTRVNVLPSPTRLCTSTWPRWALMTCFTMASPSPDPSRSRESRSSTR